MPREKGPSLPSLESINGKLVAIGAILATIVTILTTLGSIQDGIQKLIPASATPTTVAAAPTAPTTSDSKNAAPTTVSAPGQPVVSTSVGPPQTPTLEPISPMQGSFLNVGIAPFGRLSESGKLEAWADGVGIARAFAQTLTSELKSLVELQQVEVRFEGVQALRGRTEEDRESFARGEMARHNAHLLVGGWLRVVDGQPYLEPVYYVGNSDLSGNSRLDGAEEMIGAHRLSARFETSPVAAPEALASRASMLTKFTLGLAHIQAGDHLPADSASEQNQREKRDAQYERALQAFDEALKLLPADARGREVLHLFRGATLLRFDFRTAAAIDAFNEALRANSEYARAYVGLGYAHVRTYLTWPTRELTPESEARRRAELQMAEQDLLRAINATDKPAEALVDAKITTALGLVNLVKAQDVDPSAYSTAETLLRRITDQYERGNSTMQYLASFAYFGLGAISDGRDGNREEALRHYESALKLKKAAHEIAEPARVRIDTILCRGGKFPGENCEPYKPTQVRPRFPLGGMG
jgi:tetratricopeptide (TPR) repeat protein